MGLPLSVGYDYKWKEENSPKGTRYVADLAINEDEAKVVTYIHSLFPHMLYRQIAVHLNELAAQGKIMLFPLKYNNLRQKYGTHRAWRDADITNIIKNDLYVGRLQYAVNSRSTYLRGLDPIYIYRQDLRILPDEVFERNQQIAAQRRRIVFVEALAPAQLARVSWPRAPPSGRSTTFHTRRAAH